MYCTAIIVLLRPNAAFSLCRLILFPYSGAQKFETTFPLGLYRSINNKLTLKVTLYVSVGIWINAGYGLVVVIHPLEWKGNENQEDFYFFYYTAVYDHYKRDQIKVPITFSTTLLCPWLHRCILWFILWILRAVKHITPDLNARQTTGYCLW